MRQPTGRLGQVLAASRPAGFTLVEIALAVGIFAFAIVAIMALFPVGLKSASESRIQTIVAQIARTVLSDLRTGDFKAARVVTSPPPANPLTFTAFDLSQPAAPTVYLLYKSDGTVLAASTAAKYASGDVTGDFFVKIDSKLVQATAPVLAQVTVTVEAPAAAKSANRTAYPVVTLMGDTR